MLTTTIVIRILMRGRTQSTACRKADCRLVCLGQSVWALEADKILVGKVSLSI